MRRYSKDSGKERLKRGATINYVAAGSGAPVIPTHMSFGIKSRRNGQAQPPERLGSAPTLFQLRYGSQPPARSIRSTCRSDRGRKIDTPVLALPGARAIVGKMFDWLAIAPRFERGDWRRDRLEHFLSEEARTLRDRAFIASHEAPIAAWP